MWVNAVEYDFADALVELTADRRLSLREGGVEMFDVASFDVSWGVWPGLFSLIRSGYWRKDRENGVSRQR
jgi:hypothetical protein